MNTIGDTPTHRSERHSAAQIAQRLGVSKAAVSYALNGRPGVSADTRAKILNLAEEFGIPTTDKARQFESGAPLVGLILADLSNPFYQDLGVEVANHARLRGYETLLAHTGDNAEEVLSAAETMAKHGVSGVILTASQDGDARAAQILRNYHIPFVQVSRKLVGVNAGFVGIDNRRAAYQVSQHMISHDYRKIAVVVGPHESSASNQRLQGISDALAEGGIRVPQQWVIRTNLGISGGNAAGEHLLDQDALPEAVICGTDAIACGLVQRLALAGIRVPEDVAISGFDGVTPFGNPDLVLTTIVQPRQEMATGAVNYIDSLVKGMRIMPHDVICKYKIRIGNSCRCDTQRRIS